MAKQWVPGTTEAERRSAVSRAYYALYHAGMAYAVGQHYPGVERSTHDQLWLWLQGRPDPAVRVWATDAQDVYWARIRADYKADRTGMDRMNAERWVTQAERLLIELRNF